MLAGPELKIDADLVGAWVDGWALSRGVPPPTSAYGGLRVDVGLPDQKARVVFAEASVGLEEASHAIQEPFVFLKVCASPERVQARLAPGWTFKPVSFFMTLHELDGADPEIAAGYRLDYDLDRSGYLATLRSASGDLAASGRLFLSGRTAVFDRIETHVDHRRRGLGRAIMRRLEHLAVQAGASQGALVATADGRGLYSALGWRLASLYTTAVRREPLSSGP